MSSSAQYPQSQRTLRAKKAANAAAAQPLTTNAGPTSFFLRSEKDIEALQQRGRKTSREIKLDTALAEQETSVAKAAMNSSMVSENSSFGVQSLEDTINSGIFSNDRSLSRTDSNISDASAEPGADSNAAVAGRKRKAGNPVHPRIAAAGQRIISGDYQTARTGSPVSLRSIDSPIRPHLRRSSNASSINLNFAGANESQPLTPLKMSPNPASAMPSTPRTGSPKSFRLSDEEVSVASDTNSQAVQSSSDEDEEGVTGTLPQLVMPSLAMPSRRPFTEKGRRIGRLKIMVVGGKGVGKTSLIQSLFRACEDVVHVDPAVRVRHAGDEDYEGKITEVCASTRPYPGWWTDFESRRMLLRRKSVGEGALERNLTFIDTPGLSEGGLEVQQVRSFFHDGMVRMGHLERMSDSELVGMLSGEGGVQVDAVVWIFDSRLQEDKKDDELKIEGEEMDLLQKLSKWTNVVPVVGFADAVEPTDLVQRKKQLLRLFDSLDIEPYFSYNFEQHTNPAADEAEPSEPLAVSSALADDSETLDASILMASDYFQPLIPSQLSQLSSLLFDPENAARLRHLSAIKFLLWRQQNLASTVDLHKHLLTTHSPDPTSAAVSVLSAEDPSKVLVPHSTSSYYRSESPAISDRSANEGVITLLEPTHARELNNASPSEPFRQVRLAKWARDLQRSLERERRRFTHPQILPLFDGADGSDTALTRTTSGSKEKSRRPAKGHLGGPISVIDPADPLGLLAFSQSLRRRGFVAVRVIGVVGMGVWVGWWIVRHWGEVVETLGLDFGVGGRELRSITAVPPPPMPEVLREGDLGFWGGVLDWVRLPSLFL